MTSLCWMRVVISRRKEVLTCLGKRIHTSKSYLRDKARSKSSQPSRARSPARLPVIPLLEMQSSKSIQIAIIQNQGQKTCRPCLRGAFCDTICLQWARARSSYLQVSLFSILGAILPSVRRHRMSLLLTPSSPKLLLIIPYFSFSALAKVLDCGERR